LAKDQLSAQERQLYQGHFCALCHSLDSWGGKLASLLTNYDTTFWLLVLAALDERQKVVPKACTALPWRKVPVVELSPPARGLAAALTLALAGAKVEDDRQDGDRPWVSWAFLPLRKSYQRALPWLDKVEFPRSVIEELGLHQRQAEQAATSLLELCRPTQQMLAEIFGFLADFTGKAELRPTLLEVGRSLGLWIYLYDAYQDRERDRRSGAFNALERFPQDPEELGSQMLHALHHLQSALQELPLGPQEVLLRGHLRHLRAKTVAAWPKTRRGTDWICWLGGAAALGGPAARAADCDCGGCDGCDCSGCECPGCDCHGGHCDGCSSCDCDGCCSNDCCQQCPTCDLPDCCDCCDSGCWDACYCVDSGTGSPPPQQAQEEEEGLPGAKRVKTPWRPFRRKPKGSGSSAPEESASDDPPSEPDLA